jgi:hypothetical protein
MTRRLKLVALVAWLGAWAVSGAVQAQAPAVDRSVPALTDRIEEDWELEVRRPNPGRSGPQVTTTMRPAAGPSAPFFAFNLNYRELPAFNAGGIQVVGWSGRTLGGSSASGTTLLAIPDERITWTQSMTLSDSTLRFAVKDGRSETWGEFGQDHGLEALSLSTDLDSLVGYDPTETQRRSGVGWQPNRTAHLTLTRVRYYAGETLLQTLDLSTESGD